MVISPYSRSPGRGFGKTGFLSSLSIQSGRAVRQLIAEYKSLDDVNRAYPGVELEKLHQVGEVRVPLTAERAKDELKESDRLTVLIGRGVP